jgi:transcriptional regulator with XRE-family HTH domain
LFSDDSAPAETPSVGARLRKRRKALGMTLRQVADASNLTEGYISQLERGLTTGSIRSLQRLGDVLGFAVGDLFGLPASTGPAVARFGDTEGLAYGVRGHKLRLTPNHFDHLDLFIGILEPGGSSGNEAYSHGASEELFLVIEGQVDVTIGEQTFTLRAMDSIPYSSSVPHRIQESGGSRAVVLWAMSPRSF